MVLSKEWPSGIDSCCGASSIGPSSAATGTTRCWSSATSTSNRAILPRRGDVGDCSCPRKTPLRRASCRRFIQTPIWIGHQSAHGACWRRFSKGGANRTRDELESFARAYPEAEGELGGRRGKYAELLGSLLNDSTHWPAEATAGDWLTFAGDRRRNKVAVPISTIDDVVWRLSLDARVGEGPAENPPAACRRYRLGKHVKRDHGRAIGRWPAGLGALARYLSRRFDRGKKRYDCRPVANRR